MKKGFTLIELLVVIAIIGLLTVIGYLNLSRARAEARDSVRLAQLNQFQKGLELYYTYYGSYPCGKNNWDSGGAYDTTRDVSFVGGWDCPADPQDDIPAFLNGRSAYNATWCPAGSGPLPGLYHEGITGSNCFVDPSGSGTSGIPARDRFYAYTVDSARQLYVLETSLEAHDSLMQNDGGCCDVSYELGNGVGLLESHCPDGTPTC